MLIGGLKDTPGEGSLIQMTITHPTVQAEVKDHTIRLGNPYVDVRILPGESKEPMSYEYLAALIAAHQATLEAQPEARTTHESILSILQALASLEMSTGHAIRLLRLQALRSTDAHAHATLYRQAAADIRQMQRE